MNEPANYHEIVMLSVLMPTTPERHQMFTKLFNEVHRQQEYMQTFHKSLGQIEILVDDSPRFLNGGPSVGKKREALVNRASGEYLCFLDSDEEISPDYLETLVRLCYQGYDVCTFKAMVKLSTFWAIVDMRLAFKSNEQISPDFTVRRLPWHICPVRTRFAKQFTFSDKNNAEDFEWMEKVLTKCQTEAHSDRIIFCYNHGDHSEVDKIPL